MTAMHPKADIRLELLKRSAYDPKRSLRGLAAMSELTLVWSLDETMNVFFYGLFMDENLLVKKGIAAKHAVVGYVDGFRLRIGERATLQRSAGARTYGVMMEVSANEVRELYAESSVSDYVPESVTVELINGNITEATCYNLPSNKVTGTNKRYAEALLELANQLGLPETYLGQIRQAGS